MASATVRGLKAKSDTAWGELMRQVEGMEPYLERADAPGEWTAREVLSHLLFEPGTDMVAFLKSFALKDLPVKEVEPGSTYLDARRERMRLEDFVDALDAQRRGIFDYLDSLADADLERKARIPLFKTFMGTDEIAIPVFVGAMFDYHW
ncbi:MAG TPA: DinB family protein, partial [Methylomirabilota bacterium]|nr:DinB family protein [Methylomirabilota bacterium]